MCKCLQHCLETCYWHLIEKRFCYDESIALYEVPEKEEKNNNCFDNLAFYDSVSVIAGRAIVTIDPLPEEKPIVQQPTRKLRWQNEVRNRIIPQEITRAIPRISESCEEDYGNHAEKRKSDSDTEEKKLTQAPKPEPDTPDLPDKPKLETLKPENLEPEVEIRRKSLKDRRMSKSLYLKIDQPKEIPIIRQQSMPKFYLDTPDDQASTSMFRTPSAALTSPVPKSSAFVYDLYSVVQMERARVQNMGGHVPIHRKESDRSSRLLQIRDKIKLRRVKSSLGTSITNLPHSHQHI
ncbi:uncharacterized protein LOC135134654 isoform X2 [Zophobas morio]|uniref:uncharacterized protein LOC135134654 isoform X2 n=1 Tax=Zophobas morio TaxID=2755281 RepID=UPI00308341F6